MAKFNLILKFEKIENYRYITKKSIIKIHDYLIYEFNDKIELGILNDSILDFYFVKYYMIENIIYRIAYIFNSFLQDGHPFIDGNKRTGFLVCFYMLKRNGFKIKKPMTFESNYKLFSRWASNTEYNNLDEIIEWIKENTN